MNNPIQPGARIPVQQSTRLLYQSRQGSWNPAYLSSVEVLAMNRILCVVVLILALTASSAPAQEPIKLGFLYILSGRVAQFGQIAKQGAQLAIDEINNAGGINGREVKGIFEDTKADPKVTLEAAQKLVNEDRVDGLIGIISSRVAEGVVPHMVDLRTPLIVTTALTPVITGRGCNRYTFRITYNLDANLKTAAILAAQLPAKKWTTVGPDYSLGHISWKLFQKHLKKLKPDVQFLPSSEVVFAPLKTTEWDPILEKLKRSDADGVLISLWGGNFIDFVKTGNRLGLFREKREFLASVVSLTATLGLRTAMPAGIWLTPPYFFQANPSAINKRFVQAYESRYKVPPAYQAQFAYSGVKAYAEAVKRAGTTNKEAVVNALEGLMVELPVGKVTIRPEDHQAVFDVICGKSTTKLSFTPYRRPYRGLDSLVTFSSDQVFTSPDQTGCVMQGSQ